MTQVRKVRQIRHVEIVHKRGAREKIKRRCKKNQKVSFQFTLRQPFSSKGSGAYPLSVPAFRLEDDGFALPALLFFSGVSDARTPLTTITYYYCCLDNR